jgi:hypothetical protein
MKFLGFLMDYYSILGISPNVTEDELKKAFRKMAMKYHPDRAGNSTVAKDKFFEITRAYKVLTREIRNKTKQDQSSSAYDRVKSGDAGFYEGKHWNEMLEYAISLAKSGYTREGVRIKVLQKGCDKKMAASVSDQAFKLQENLNRKADTAENSGSDKTKNLTRKFDYQTIASLLGEQDPNRSSYRKISYYLDVFNDIESGAIFASSKNRYLSKVFNRAILLFLVLSGSVYFLPVIFKFIPLGLVDLFQLPSILLSLMLVWSVYRKLWLLSLIGVFTFGLTQLYYYHSMPASIEQGFSSILLTAFICYLPFVFFTRGANYFFCAKAKNIVESVNTLYPEIEDKLILIKNLGGVSRLTAFMVTIFLSFYFLYMIPENGSLYDKYNWLVPDYSKRENKDFKQIQSKANEAERLYRLAEEHFNRNPPQYEDAKNLYLRATDYGSLLSSYKLGYMFFVGKGGMQDDKKAFYYFNKAINSPLANQPHNLGLVTKWLSESYKSLGIMYLGGYGTLKNTQKAEEMFRLAIKYGAKNENKNLLHIGSLKHQNLRNQITYPGFSQ